MQIEGLEIGRLLGGGSFGEVFAAIEPAFDRTVAVKVFRAGIDPKRRSSFEREATASGRLTGTRNVIHVYRSGVMDDGRPYIVMELLDGSLAERVAERPMTVDKVVHVGAVIGRALAAAHAKGIIHRDIKPENILVDSYGEPVISDFGIASALRPQPGSSIYAFTPQHAAPEQFDRRDQTAAGDVYALSSTMYELLEGDPPFVQSEDEGLLPFMRRVQGSAPPPFRHQPIDTEVESLIRRGLSKDPSDRPSMEEVAESCERFERARAKAASSGRTTTVPPELLPPADPQRRRGSGLIFVSVATIAAVALLAYFLTRDSNMESARGGGTTTTQFIDHSLDTSPVGSQPATESQPIDTRATTPEETADFTNLLDTLYGGLSDDSKNCLSSKIFPLLSTVDRDFLKTRPLVVYLPTPEQTAVGKVIRICVPSPTAAEIVVDKGYIGGLPQLTPEEHRCLVSNLAAKNTSDNFIIGLQSSNALYQASIALSVSTCLTDPTQKQQMILALLQSRLGTNDGGCVATHATADVDAVLHDVFASQGGVVAAEQLAALGPALTACGVERLPESGFRVNNSATVTAKDFAATNDPQLTTTTVSSP